jgi:hypothetical protein
MGKYVAIAVTIVFGVLWGSSASSQDIRSDANSRWIPGFSLGVGFRTLDIESTVTSDRGHVNGHTQKLYGYVTASIDLMSPVIADVSSAPRIFVRIGVANSFDGDERVANEGGPGEIVIPTVDRNDDGIPDSQPPLAAVFGQGSGTAVEASSMIGTAGIGVDFSFEWLERKVHLRPSFEWVVQQQRVKALLGYAEVAPISTNPELCPCLSAFVSGEESEYLHGIGPGIEVGVDAGRLGPFLLNVFAGAQAYYELDRKMSVVATGPLEPAGRDVSVRSTYESDRWDYRIGVGIRFDWLPE